MFVRVVGKLLAAMAGDPEITHTAEGEMRISKEAMDEVSHRACPRGPGTCAQRRIRQAAWRRA